MNKYKSKTIIKDYKYIFKDKAEDLKNENRVENKSKDDINKNTKNKYKGRTKNIKS